MTSMILEVYDAFKSVGIDDDKARAAAGALSGNKQQFGDLKSDIDSRFDQIDRKFDQIDQKLDQLDRKFDQVERRFEKMQADIDRRFDQAELKNEKRFSKIEAELLLMKWMLGVTFAGVASLVAKAFF